MHSSEESIFKGWAELLADGIFLQQWQNDEEVKEKIEIIKENVDVVVDKKFSFFYF